MSPAFDLQKAIWRALTTSADLKAAFGNVTPRVYDRVPGGSPTKLPTLPYITTSAGQENDAGDTCEQDRFEVFQDCHVWSEAVGQLEAKVLAGIIRDVLLAGFPVNRWNLQTTEFQTTRYLEDPDGITTHAIVTFRFILDPT